MKLQIIRSSREDSKNKSGIGYYADFLEEQIQANGNEVSSICFNFGPNYSLKRIFIDNIVRPIIEIIRGRKNTDVVHAVTEHCAFFLPFAKAKKVVTFHHVMASNEVPSKLWVLMWRISVLISKIYADEFVAISPTTKENMIKALNIPREKITVAMHPPNSEMYREDITKEDLVIFVGSFTARKNPLAAVTVFRKMLDVPEFKGYRLIMCGTGPERDNIENMISELGLGKHVDLVSNLSTGELRSLYGRCRYLLNTSNFEGLGITTLEAQMCGSPVLYFEDADIPPEVMIAAISCQDVDDMVTKALELIVDERRMEKVIEDGIVFSNNFGTNYAESLEIIYKRNNDKTQLAS